MKSDKLQDAIGEIRDDYILDAHGEHGEMKGKKRYPQVAAVLLLLLLAAGVLWGQNLFPQKTVTEMQKKQQTSPEKITEITKIAENLETNEPEKEIKREEQLEVNIVQRQMQEESWTEADWSADHDMVIIQPQVPEDLQKTEETDRGKEKYVVYQSGDVGRKIIITAKTGGGQETDDSYESMNATQINGTNVYFFRYDDETEEIMYACFTDKDIKCEVKFQALTESEIRKVIVSMIE